LKRRLRAGTHRVAISNQRLLDVADGRVTFRYKDYADSHQQKTLRLCADEFLRRFSVKIRHYGLLANRKREANLKRCRRLLLVQVVATNKQWLPESRHPCRLVRQPEVVGPWSICSEGLANLRSPTRAGIMAAEWSRPAGFLAEPAHEVDRRVSRPFGVPFLDHQPGALHAGNLCVTFGGLTGRRSGTL
jgi:hypothetical protein